MARDLLNRAFAPTAPDDLLDPPRFSQLVETCKDTVVLELRRFIDNALQTSERREELPTIEKYASFGAGSGDPYETVARVVRKNPDVLERLPHIAVLATTGQQRALSIGPPIMCQVQKPPRIVAELPDPYVFEDGDVIQVRTRPDGVNYKLSNLTLTAGRFTMANPIGAALASDAARVINEQALYVKASVEEDGPDNYLVLENGGPQGSVTGRNEIEIASGTSANILDVTGLGRTDSATAIAGTAPDMQLKAPPGTFTSADVGRSLILTGSDRAWFNDGRFEITDFSSGMGVDTLTYTNKYGKTEGSWPGTWFIGSRDTDRNPLRPPMNRYWMGSDLNIQIDILTQEENTRGELVDLVYAFFTFFAESKFFTFMGRSGFEGETTENESFQVILKSSVRNGGEQEAPRPGDNSGKVYINTLSVDVHALMYLNREVLVPDTVSDPFIVEGEDVDFDDTLPQPS